MNEVFYSSIFGELTKQVQIRIDAASELRKRLFDQNIYERFLDWDTPTVGLNFEELIGSYNLSVAAATLDSKGKEPIMGTEGLETIKQKVLTTRCLIRCLSKSIVRCCRFSIRGCCPIRPRHSSSSI